LSTFFIILLYPSSFYVAIGSTNPPAQVSGIFLVGKARQEHKADNLTAIY
jgi:hypothetical protein